ncbi:hypothetical protein BDA96_04G269900 [Sorghum bicolor]|uniref:Uncharacterized protein n=2 Tax=Sorghum bicolor TaxID=4558 RepID=A0A1Z5RPK7_SORBI|nr:hypothetical protein BDA96_04G269900 [Sorghum bicolor]OQU85478.1 hypothetical protein SORBI_3004G253050 [Sorghum bicolor]OQU85479.1 hypothetical protein SORBI_3004G253050 [Sorghum bicolor]
MCYTRAFAEMVSMKKGHKMQWCHFRSHMRALVALHGVGKRKQGKLLEEEHLARLVMGGRRILFTNLDLEEEAPLENSNVMKLHSTF